MKLIFGIWVLLSALLFLGRWAVASEDVGRSTINRLQLEIDLSFVELQERIAEGRLSSDQARDLMARWYEETGEKRKELEQLRSEVRTNQQIQTAAPLMPETLPSQEGKTEEEFLFEVRNYFAQASRAIWHGVDTDDQTDFNRGRDRFSRFMESAQSKFLVEESLNAHNEIMRGLVRRPPMAEAELSELSPEERLDEQIYTEVYQELFDRRNRPEPIRDPEEWRDAMAALRPMVDQRRRLFWESHPNLHLQQIQARRLEILNQLSDVQQR